MEGRNEEEEAIRVWIIDDDDADAPHTVQDIGGSTACVACTDADAADLAIVVVSDRRGQDRAMRVLSRAHARRGTLFGRPCLWALSCGAFSADPFFRVRVRESFGITSVVRDIADLARVCARLAAMSERPLVLLERGSEAQSDGAHTGSGEKRCPDQAEHPFDEAVRAGIAESALRPRLEGEAMLIDARARTGRGCTHGDVGCDTDSDRGRSETVACPFCGASGLAGAEQLLDHFALFHVHLPPTRAECPLCVRGAGLGGGKHRRRPRGGDSVPCTWTSNIARHVFHHVHPSPAGGGERPCFKFSLVVCVRPEDGKMLLVDEVAAMGFWLPGGRVDPGETFIEAALRETREEAGVDVTLDGVLAFEHTPCDGYDRTRVIFLASPAGRTRDPPKAVPDEETIGAVWVDLDKIEKLPLRGGEPVEWARFLSDGGSAAPMSIIKDERRRRRAR